MAEPAFQLVPDDEPEAPPKQSALHSAAIATLLLSLKVLSQRTLLAIDNLFTLITVGLAFWLWTSIPEPNPYQLVSQGVFAVFVLAANVIVRRK